MTFASRRPPRSYQWLLVTLLSVNFGIVFFDRQALNILMPFVQPEMGLSNSQIGALSGALAFSWAISGLFVGRLSDLLGRRKLLLVIAALVFSSASMLSGFATSFAMLLATRLLMGIAEGGVMPISQALIASDVDPARRGLAMGITQNFGSNLISNFLGPIVLVAFATAYGWRNTFYMAAGPGFVIAMLMLWLVREPDLKADSTTNEPRASFRETLRNRNVWVCMCMAVLLVGFLVIYMTFAPLYLVQGRGLTQATMSWLMAMAGCMGIVFSFVVPGLSDLIGRRPVITGACAVGLLWPLGILFANGTVPLYAAFMLGAAISGIFPLIMATVPSESVPPSQWATVLGLAMGVGEVLGGVFGPAIAGSVADRVGLQAPFWIMSGLVVVACVLSFALIESAPNVLKRRNAQLSVARERAV